jgi:hypothetical protein
MKLVNIKLLAGITVSILIGGCSTNMDGSHTFGARSSPMWAVNAPRADVEAYYDSMSVENMCATWKARYWEGRRSEPILIQITGSLKRRGMEPSYCDKVCRKNDGECKPNIW